MVDTDVDYDFLVAYEEPEQIEGYLFEPEFTPDEECMFGLVRGLVVLQTSITLLWTLYELAKQPELQDELRAEIAAARVCSQGNMVEMLKLVPLVKATLKETLRVHPVAVNLPRYITEDVVIQNYHVPSGTLVQLGLYAMGRDHQIFQHPEKFLPSRWLQGSQYFRSLGFGFGPRQCVGRRIAETEMQLFLIHMLEKFKIENEGHVDMRSTFALIMVPEKPIVLTIRPL